MDNFKDDILKCLSQLSLNEEIQISDIPKLDLYMDQVITLFENGLNNLKRNEEDKLLTKTMINNYTKDKILMPTKNKKYSPDHIIMMILIYNLKQTLSINDIKVLLDKTVKGFQSEEKNNIELVRIYDDFLKVKQIEADNFENGVKEKIDLILSRIKDRDTKEDNYEKLLLMVLTLINSSNIQKRLAERIIDKFLKSENE